MVIFFEDDFIKIDIQMLDNHLFRPVIFFKKDGPKSAVFEETTTSKEANDIAGRWMVNHLKILERAPQEG